MARSRIAIAAQVSPSAPYQHEDDPMAKEQKEKPETPTYDVHTLFVAVADGMQVYAGYDGGLQTGGKGRWRVGEVGPWTANLAVPLAYRDPSDGLIWKGWLEVAEQTVMDQNGKLKCLKSKKLFAEPLAKAELAAERAANRSKATTLIEKEPTPRAKKRATQGAGSMVESLEPLVAREQRSRAERAGLPIAE